jgi:hypothetical protein
VNIKQSETGPERINRKNTLTNNTRLHLGMSTRLFEGELLYAPGFAKVQEFSSLFTALSQSTKHTFVMLKRLCMTVTSTSVINKTTTV